MDEVFRRQIGARLKIARKAAGMTQEYVASDLGLSRQAVCSWEHGREMPRSEAWFRLGLLYGVSLDFIIYGIRTVPVSQSPLMAVMFQPPREPMESDA